MWGQHINYTPTEPTEDLKAFERRLREVINGLGPKARLWRVILFIVTLSFLTTAYFWLVDPKTYQFGFVSSLQNHPQFVISLVSLIALFLMGAHKKVILPNIIAHRCRVILAEYNMTCDNSGKLILRPKPTL
ncbi:Nuclear envelope phosphatase-regulatory subunit 1 [Clonorchis sinensis]|uniref:Transmembrane protein 188 n=2 Tax=Clonorchis sinensis TaxID=79923 RepID=G7YQI8_CLOSI|nr:Nuclear envelope phosphatase-regulatory subunit 1 [Clonorchis sinensis]GAA55218.1 transmembrane protein 188 [Clonorchis sinensis]